MNNIEAFERAASVLVGGVDSPVRAWKGVGGTPLSFVGGRGAYLEDVEGKGYVDYVGSWGPLIVGHSHPQVVRAICERAQRGISFGAPSPLETKLAETIRRTFPSMEKIRFVTSGTEATMTALRLARGATGRSLVVKFAGCYHGHHDGMLVSSGSGSLTLGQPDSAGVLQEVARCTAVVPYNDREAVKALFNARGQDIAAVIVEPWAGNMGLVPPLPGFLEELRNLTAGHGALLIFDEVITGFRTSEGGVQQKKGIRPDLTCLGKIIGGGLPVGAVGGRAEVMDHLAPLGPVYQAGTLAGNPLAMAAGLATLEVLASPGVREKLEDQSAFFAEGLAEAARSCNLPLSVTRLGSVLGLFFSSSVPRNLDEVRATEGNLYPLFFHAMVRRGHLFAPSPFEATFVSLAHDRSVLESTLGAALEVFSELAERRQ
ncbi:glutamate-1-semialdehyde 2,1-aminomutase [Aminithiophilus ramosus]|uniref:Glutamate-1-semialdehyde 2,1-aminomutase n=1 Tax=Aminithiophilus ramosus TaxID=3029084 RepID=A0A9Q7AP67_9BACT|nr:glutamate-1-semialdehyde 2,1-aminomutase [Aminithiophilus ramosus]QTX32992.1 glutamate-1-semialdehyde 2,1-aminomutase [Aminithiophilus ramosus]